MRSNRSWLPAFVVVVVLFSWPGMRGQTAPERAAKAPAHDLTGLWRRARRAPDKKRQYTIFELTASLGNEIAPMTPWGEEKFNAAKPNGGAKGVSLAESNDPALKCFPPGVPRIYTSRLGAPFEIVQSQGRVIMLFEYDHIVREIYTDGRPHPPDLNPTWMGDSIGRWEGNTLVVDTVGFNDKSWLDSVGHPHSDALHLVERIQRVGRDTMIDDITIDDPKSYSKPWVSHMRFELKPDWSLLEYVCEDFLNFQDLEQRSESPK